MRFMCLLLVVSALFPATVLAQSPMMPVAAALCANCHGTDGRIDGPIPAIAGKPASVLAERLRDFKADRVPGATVMPRLIKGLTETEIDLVAGYFAAARLP